MEFNRWFAAYSYYYIEANIADVPLETLLAELEASRDKMYAAFAFKSIEDLKGLFN